MGIKVFMACYTIVSNEDKKRCALSFAKAFMTRHYIDTTAMVTVAWNMENSIVVVCEFCFPFYDINFFHFYIYLQNIYVHTRYALVIFQNYYSCSILVVDSYSTFYEIYNAN